MSETIIIQHEKDKNSKKIMNKMSMLETGGILLCNENFFGPKISFGPKIFSRPQIFFGPDRFLFYAVSYVWHRFILPLPLPFRWLKITFLR